MSENKWLICPNCDIIIENNYRQIICGECKNKFVPVVSLQALKEYCKENGKITDYRCMCYKEALDDLLLWVKKQGVEKR